MLGFLSIVIPAIPLNSFLPPFLLCSNFQWGLMEEMCLGVFVMDDGCAFYCSLLLFFCCRSSSKSKFMASTLVVSAASIIVSNCVFALENWLQTFSVSAAQCKWIVLFQLMICGEVEIEMNSALKWNWNALCWMWGGKSVEKTRHLDFCQIPALQMAFMHLNEVESLNRMLMVVLVVTSSLIKLSINFRSEGGKGMTHQHKLRC